MYATVIYPHLIHSYSNLIHYSHPPPFFPIYPSLHPALHFPFTFPLTTSEKDITAAVTHCIQQAKGHHVLNLGHGVEKDTPEENVKAFVHAARHVKI